MLSAVPKLNGTKEIRSYFSLSEINPLLQASFWCEEAADDQFVSLLVKLLGKLADTFFRPAALQKQSVA